MKSDLAEHGRCKAIVRDRDCIQLCNWEAMRLSQWLELTTVEAG